MAVWLSAVSIGAGYCFGAIVGLVFYERHREVRRKNELKKPWGPIRCYKHLLFLLNQEDLVHGL